MVLPLIPLASALLPLVADLAPPVTRFLVGDKSAESVQRVTENARVVADAVQRITGEPATTPDEVAAVRAKIAASPDLQAKLEMELARVDVELERIELERDKAYLADVQNARQRDITLREAGSGNIRANLMLISAFVAVIAIVGLLIWMPAKNPNAQTIIGFVTGIGGMFARNIGSAFDFEFGSSRGSKNKEAILGQELTSARESATAAGAVVASAEVARTVQDIANTANKVREALGKS